MKLTTGLTSCWMSASRMAWTRNLGITNPFKPIVTTTSRMPREPDIRVDEQRRGSPAASPGAPPR